jgi:hypothetical protein
MSFELLQSFIGDFERFSDFDKITKRVKTILVLWLVFCLFFLNNFILHICTFSTLNSQDYVEILNKVNRSYQFGEISK